MSSQVSFLEIPTGHLVVVHVPIEAVRDEKNARRHLRSVKPLFGGMPTVLRGGHGDAAIVIGDRHLTHHARSTEVETLPILEFRVSAIPQRAAS